MSLRQAYRPAQALFNVFIGPCSSQLPSRSRAMGPNALELPGLTRIQRAYVHKGKRPVQQEIRKERWNDEIRAKWIKLTDPVTNELQPPVLTRDVLKKLDTNIDRLIQLTPDDPFDSSVAPVCKIVNKKDEYDQARRREQARKAAVRVRALETSVKTLEINWAIDHHDLDMRINRMQTFLAEGRRVEVIMASKKRGRRASEEEARAVHKKIKAALDAVPGSREYKPMEGKVGTVAMIFYQGKAPVAPKPQEVKQEVQQEAVSS